MLMKCVQTPFVSRLLILEHPWFNFLKLFTEDDDDDNDGILDVDEDDDDDEDDQGVVKDTEL